MAMNLPGFGPIIEQFAAERLEKEILWVIAGTPLFDGPPTEEQKQRAKEILERIVSEGKLWEVLEATAPKPEVVK